MRRAGIFACALVHTAKPTTAEILEVDIRGQWDRGRSEHLQPPTTHSTGKLWSPFFQVVATQAKRIQNSNRFEI